MRGLQLALPALLLVGLVLPVQAGDSVATVNLVLGLKQLDDDDWRPVEDQSAAMVETSWGGKDWPVHVAADVGWSNDSSGISGIRFEGTTLELDLGARRWFRKTDRLRPYAGAGVAFVKAEVEAAGFGDSSSDDDTATGFWVGAGLAWRVGGSLQLGVAARYSDAEATLAGTEGEAGGATFGVLIGWTSLPRYRKL